VTSVRPMETFPSEVQVATAVRPAWRRQLSWRSPALQGSRRARGVRGPHVLHQIARSSSSLGFHCIPRDLPPLPMWPSGHSCARSRRVTRMNDRWRPSWTWRCLQSACRCTGSTLIDPPLLEFVLVVCPASDISAARPLPGGVATPIRSAAATQPTCSALVVSHHFDGLRHAEASSLLHPEAGRGSLRFQVPRPSMADRSRRLVGLGSLPRNAVHTLRRIPLVSSRTASPRPLPSCRSDDYRPPERRSTRTDLKTAPTSRRNQRSPSAEAMGSCRCAAVIPRLPGEPKPPLHPPDQPGSLFYQAYAHSR